MTTHEVPLLARERAEIFLRAYLGVRRSGAWRKEVMAAGAAEGLRERMIAQVAKDIGVVSRSAGVGGAIWSLPLEPS